MKQLLFLSALCMIVFPFCAEAKGISLLLQRDMMRWLYGKPPISLPEPCGCPAVHRKRVRVCGKVSAIHKRRVVKKGVRPKKQQSWDDSQHAFNRHLNKMSKLTFKNCTLEWRRFRRV